MGIINHCSLGCESAGEESVGEVTHMVKLTLSSSGGHAFFRTTEKVFSVRHLRWQLASLGMSKQEGVSKTADTLFLPRHLRSDSPAGMSVAGSQCSIQATVQVRESDKSKNEVRQVTVPFSMLSAF